MKIEECKLGLLVLITPSRKGRRPRTNAGEIVGFCNGHYEGYVLVKKTGMEVPQKFHPSRLNPLTSKIIARDPDDVIQKGVTVC